MTTPSWHLAFAGKALLVRTEGATVALPDAGALAHLLGADPGAMASEEIPLPPFEGAPCHAYDLPDDFQAPAGFAVLGLREVYERIPPALFRVAGTALQKVEWLRTHGYCSRCGHATERHAVHQAMVCPVCGHLHFPRLSPAVIVMVERGPEMLLARSPRFPDGMYSTVAGFVEPGESLEETVHREIMEEVGVEVTDVRYFGSQPWPFPHSLMIGFTARWLRGDIEVDDDEIEDAQWFSADRLPERLPSRLSIARRLVDDFLDRNGIAPSGGESRG